MGEDMARMGRISQGVRSLKMLSDNVALKKSFDSPEDCNGINEEFQVGQ